MKYIKSFLVIILLAMSVSAFADTSSPTTMLRTVSTKAINELKVEKAKLKGDQKVPLEVMHRIINQVLLPHVDLDTMSRAVLGRNTWSKATPSQKARFKKEFTDLVINTYASALTTFDKNRIKFYRVRGGYKGKSIIQVNSTVNAPGAPALPVVYHLENKDNQWKIFDLSVDGISLIQSFQAQFAAQVQENGLDGLIKTLDKHNDTLEAQG